MIKKGLCWQETSGSKASLISTVVLGHSLSDSLHPEATVSKVTSPSTTSHLRIALYRNPLNTVTLDTLINVSKRKHAWARDSSVITLMIVEMALMNWTVITDDILSGKINLLIDWLIDLLTNWFIDLLTKLLIDWLIDWLTESDLMSQSVFFIRF